MIRSALMIFVPITHPNQRTQERDSEMIREITSIEHNIKYTLPFTKENIQKLYNLKNGRCSLVLKDESRGNKPPYEVESFEHYKTMEFDELWDWASTPRTKLDRSYGDQLEGSHIG
jgi:hypothetical protein